MADASAGAVDVEAVIEEAPLGPFQIAVVVLCGFVAMLDGFDTQSIAFVAPVLAAEWGVKPSAFGPIFGAGLAGIMAGQLIFGPLADKFGRRPIILLCTLWFGVLTLATAYAPNAEALLTLRFLTGIGLGGATPNIIALTSEFSPKRLRATLITVMFGGFPLGAAVGGFISSRMIPAYGWESVFLLGGIAPLVLLLLLVVGLPESVSHLVRTGASARKTAQILSRIDPGAGVGPDSPMILRDKPLSGIGFAHLFRDGRAARTLLLWVAFFCSLLMIYFLMSWLPLVLKEGGLPVDTAIISSVFLNLGGLLGGIALGRLADRYHPLLVLVAGYAVGGLCVIAIGVTDAWTQVLMAAVFGAGFFIIGGQTAMNAVTAGLYPAQVRATALGAALAVGRIGSIVGPVAGGVLMAQDLAQETLFLLVAAPALLACLMLFVLKAAVRPVP